MQKRACRQKVHAVVGEESKTSSDARHNPSDFTASTGSASAIFPNRTRRRSLVHLLSGEPRTDASESDRSRDVDRGPRVLRESPHE